jgi:hypothetical protein
MPMEPLQGRYRVFKTKKYTIHYLLDDVEVKGQPEKKIVKGGHEFFFFGDVIIIKPIKGTSATREAP